MEKSKKEELKTQMDAEIKQGIQKMLEEAERLKKENLEKESI